MEASWIQKTMQILSENTCLLGTTFGRMLVDFNGGMLAPKVNEKKMSTSKDDFVGFVRFPLARIKFFMILGVEVGRIISQKAMKN